MSTAKKNQLKRDHALNDATSGQFREEPSSLPQPDTLYIENGACKKSRTRTIKKYRLVIINCSGSKAEARHFR
ncbi:MAG TPA: hypothetical protein VFI64_03780 [Nitrososphaeraceae archaeon]|jgi:hypothetical protein|nr:hypothetical protein [Nitrososphaeraceae archaeon]